MKAQRLATVDMSRQCNHIAVFCPKIYVIRESYFYLNISWKVSKNDSYRAVEAAYSHADGMQTC